MGWFRIEILDEKGKIIELQHKTLQTDSVKQALQTRDIRKIKEEAKHHGYGFRVKLEHPSS